MRDDMVHRTRALAAIALSGALLAGIGSAEPTREAPQAEVVETVRIRWGEVHPWANVVLKGARERKILGFKRDGEEFVLELPAHDAWDFTFVGGGQDLTEDHLSRLCPELLRIEATGLSITRAWRLNDRLLKRIGEVESLERLELSDIAGYFNRAPSDPAVSRVGLQSLAKMPKLKHLLLDNFDHLSDTDYAAGLAGLEGLTALRLASCQDVGPNTMVVIGSLRKLELLSLRSTGVKDDDLRPLSANSELRVLDLAHCWPLTEQFVDHVAAARHLHTLNIGFCRSLRGNVLERLRGFRELRHLDIAGLEGLTEEHLTSLCSLPALQVLVLTGCEKVDDGTLRHLARIETLRELRLRSTSVTEAGLEAFRKRRPECEVETTHKTGWASPYDPVILLR